MPALQLVDSCYAWFIAAMCFWIQVWAAIIFRSSGILLVGLVSNFRISREEAAWPFEICTTVNSAQGFLVGILVRYWDTRTLNTGATLLAAISAIACFIWDTPTAYTVFVGLGFGAGSGLMVPTNVVVLHRYFDEYRTSASGVSFAGAALSSILLPPLIGKLLDKYGLQGTMLIVGALVLNAMAGSIAIRSTPSFPRPPHHTLFSTTIGTTLASTRCSSCENSENKNPVTDFFSTDLLLWESGIVVSGLPPRPSEPQRRRRRGMFSFFRCPMFVPLMATGVVYGYVFGTYMITIVDHAEGAAHASNEDGATLVSVMAMGDFLSRIGTGYITDRHYITREWMLIINFTVQGVCLLLLANLDTVANMAAVALVFGLNNGGTIASMPVLLADHLGDDHLPLTFGLHRLSMGVASLTRPLLIGYFKDKHGSYNGLYYLVAAACVLVAILWCVIVMADSIKALILGRPIHANALAIPA
ncbi:hypothetical protein MTO96_014611 [Rhipicephalus appendiculatus]